MSERTTPSDRFPIRFNIVGFDLDGTLLDTAPDIAIALNHALKLAGRAPLSFDEVRPLIGGGAKRLLARALVETGGAEVNGAEVDANVLDPLYAELLAHYGANIAVETRAFDGMERALDNLAEHGIALGVATNKLESLAVQLLDQMGLSGRFAAIIGGDTLGIHNAKPKPDMLHHLADLCGGGAMAFVGDSAFDMGAAKAADMPGIAVSFGYPGMPIDQLACDVMIDHYDELLPALARL